MTPTPVIPAKAGIQLLLLPAEEQLDSRVRGGDGLWGPS
jgi:hypothetical protein